MRLPQPFQYQGSKRRLASQILAFLPHKMGRLIEPFAGSAALSIAAAARGKARTFWINDLNKPLAQLLQAIINDPEAVGASYRNIWKDQASLTKDYYAKVRDEFNITEDPMLLLYLIARCLKGSIRYNSNGEFNQSPDKRRLGTRPDTMQENLLLVSTLLKGKTKITSLEYYEVLSRTTSSDVIYMDPPYQGVSTGRDSRYGASMDFDRFVEELAKLNQKEVPYAISYDGRTGSKTYGKPLPESLKLTRIELKAGVSAQATLLGKHVQTIESLYLSPALHAKVRSKGRRVQKSVQQAQLDF